MTSQLLDKVDGQVNAVPSIFQWKINNIFFEGIEINPFLKSSHFKFNKYQFQFLFRKIEGNNSGSKHLSIYLRTASNIQAFLQFILINAEKQPFSKSNILTHSFNNHNNFTFQYTTLVKNELLIDRQLIIMCKMNIAENFNIKEFTEDVFDRKEFTEVNVFDRKRLVEFDQFENMLNDRQFSAVVFNIDGQKIHAHKNIVSNRCPVFKAMFQHDMKENQRNEVHIDDIEYKVFNELLRYIYAGRVNNLSTIAYKLLIAADKYSLETLKELCETALCNDLTIHNAITYLQIADTYSAKILKCKAINFIVINRKVMNKMPTFKKIEDLPSDALSKLISSLTDASSSTS